MNGPALSRFLASIGSRARRVKIARAAGIAFAALIGIVVGAIFADGIFGFERTGLFVLDAAIIAAFGLTIVWISRAFFAARFDDRRTAMLAEQKLGVVDNALINAVEFSRFAPAGVSPELAQLAVHRGESASALANPRAAVSARPAAIAAMLATGVALVALISVLVAPRLYSAVVPRLLHPASDLPAFTILTFDISTSPKRVIYSKPASIVVDTSGPIQPMSADIMFDDALGKATIPLARRGDSGFVFHLPRPDNSRRFCIVTPLGRSEWQRLDVLRVPLLQSGTVKLEFPSYTQWPTEEHAFVPGPIRVLEGTKITFAVQSSLPLREAEIEWLPNEAKPAIATQPRFVLPCDESDAHSASASLTPISGSRFKLGLIGSDGTPSEEPFEGAIETIPDAKPQVAIVDPQETVVAPEGWKVPVRISAQDDISLAKLSLRVGIGDARPDMIEFPIDPARPWQADAAHTIDLAALHAKDGDTIRYFATAFDSKPGEDRFTDTRTQTIHVISMETYMNLARQEYGAKEMQRELEAFQQEISRLSEQRKELAKQARDLLEKAEVNEGRLSEEEARRLQELQAKLRDNAADSRALESVMNERAEAPQLYDFEDEYQESLKQAAKSLADRADATERLARAMKAAGAAPPISPSSARQMMDLARAIEESEKQDDQAGERAEQMEKDLDRLALAGELAAQAAEIADLISHQRELADNLSQFKQSPALTGEDAIRAKRLGEEQQALKEQLAQSVKRLGELAGDAAEKLPKMSSGASRVCKAIAEMGVGEDQERASQAAKSGNGTEAQQTAEQAASNLESLLSQCNSMGDKACEDLDGCFKLPKPGLQQAIKQLSGRKPGTLPGNKAGMTGSGFGGAQSRFSVMGPHFPTSNDANGGARSAMLESLRAKSGVNPAGARTAAGERLDLATPTVGRGRGVGVLADVPGRYRDEAAQYFKRLSEDANRNGGSR